MPGDGDRSRRARRVDFAVTALFGAVYAAALFLGVTGFAAESGACGGRFGAPCAGSTYARIGVGFGLVLVAPVLAKIVPDVPLEQGIGRAAAVAALVTGAAAGIAVTVVVAAALA
ncbi:hypothetical protein [Streptomyces sp. enrichment culture]|uniref:hypothetical protein n=1 Tax=Streptomyces sp. enrichment culture TaxID=1795815 RepID=UPI003F56C2D7